MTFEQALSELKTGMKVRRTGWIGGINLASMRDEIFNKTDNEEASMNYEDLLAEDWEIVREVEFASEPDPTIEELRLAVVAIADEIRLHQGYLRHSGDHIDKLRRDQ